MRHCRSGFAVVEVDGLGGRTGRPKLIESGGDGRYPGEMVAATMGNLPSDATDSGAAEP